MTRARTILKRNEAPLLAKDDHGSSKAHNVQQKLVKRVFHEDIPPQRPPFQRFRGIRYYQPIQNWQEELPSVFQHSGQGYALSSGQSTEAGRHSGGPHEYHSANRLNPIPLLHPQNQVLYMNHQWQGALPTLEGISHHPIPVVDFPPQKVCIIEVTQKSFSGYSVLMWARRIMSVSLQHPRKGSRFRLENTSRQIAAIENMALISICLISIYLTGPKNTNWLMLQRNRPQNESFERNSSLPITHSNYRQPIRLGTSSQACTDVKATILEITVPI